MARWNLSCYVLSLSIAAALLGGCGRSQPPIALPQTAPLAPRADGTHYRVVYSFGAIPDGNDATSSLVDVGGTLYGTTEYGGANACDCGTVFSITTSGNEHVIYSFASRPDGNNPYGGLTDVAGTLYGTTRFGGAYRCAVYGDGSGCGTVYSISPSGKENVLYSFSFGTDGHHPRASLIAVKGTLYGTTPDGPAHQYGTVFDIATSGAENVLHIFKKPKDLRGSSPLAALIDIKGTFYGTTSQSGAYDHGVVFSITPSGTEKVLHSFDGTDGAYPEAALVDVKGTFYSTTAFGGTYNGGTVFSITTGGTEKVLYSFRGGTSDGARPTGDLIELNGKLYGTTQRGGAYVCGTSEPCGTVFSVTLDGKEKVLHSFAGAADGAQPLAGLIDVKGTLYGTTFAGGSSGHGTVFSLKP